MFLIVSDVSDHAGRLGSSYMKAAARGIPHFSNLTRESEKSSEQQASCALRIALERPAPAPAGSVSSSPASPRGPSSARGPASPASPEVHRLLGAQRHQHPHEAQRHQHLFEVHRLLEVHHLLEVHRLLEAPT